MRNACWVKTALGSLILLPLVALVDATARLPSFPVTAALNEDTASLECQGLWWVRVQDHVLHSPPSFLGLSQNISNYYYAYGSHSALTGEMAQHRVGGAGRVHIFHLPGGSSMLQGMPQQGSRRHSISVLTELKHGIRLSDQFPQYMVTSSYTNPLGQSGLSLETSLVNMIKPRNLMLYLSNLTSLPSVSSPSRSWSSASASKAATDYLQANFQSMGFRTCLHGFRSEDGSVELHNVVAYLPGQGGATDSVTLGAHYDSRPFDGAAPGAVDNGSGVAALLAIASAFSQARVSPAKPVYFVAFGAEEPGLWGSEAFAKSLTEEGGASLPSECRPAAGFLQRKSRPAHKAIIMDEIAWRSPNLASDTVNLESYDSSKEVLDELAGASRQHNGDTLTIVHSSNPFGSDHMSFLKRGLKATLSIHGDDEAYPDYHKSSDTMANVDRRLLTRIAKMNAGGLLRLAGIAAGAR